MARQDTVSLALVIASVAIIVFVALIEHVAGAKCYKNEDVGDRDGNVYYCNSKDLSRCCVENEVPTCCQSESAKNLEEQLQLWGTVAAMIFAIALVFICCKNDIACCTSEMSLKERFQNFRNRNKPQQLVEEPEEARTKGTFFDNAAGPNFAYNTAAGRPSVNYSFPSSRALDPYNFPPLPPITPESDSSYA